MVAVTNAMVSNCWWLGMDVRDGSFVFVWMCVGDGYGCNKDTSVFCSYLVIDANLYILRTIQKSLLGVEVSGGTPRCFHLLEGADVANLLGGLLDLSKY